MKTDDKDVNETIAEFQRQAREMLRAQQEAFLAAAKSWREAADRNSVPWPENVPFPAPKPKELAEASYAFAAKLLADQSRFMQELGKVIGSREDKS